MKKRKPAGGKKARIDKEAQELQLGTMIRERREALGMSQMELCEGIYSIPNLSRIENNEQLPIRSKLRKLAQRLGVPARRFLAVLDHEDLAVWALQNEIRSDVVLHRRTPKGERAQVRQKMREKLERLRSIADPNDIGIQQFILAEEARLGENDGLYGPEQTLNMQLEAMRLTHPKFDLEEIRHSYYTLDEAELINQIANTYQRMGQRKRAIAIFEQLLPYIEKNYQELPDYGNEFCMVAKNYAADLAREARYTDAIEIAERGSEVALAKGAEWFLTGLVALQADCWFFLNNLEKSKNLYYQAYYGFKLNNDKTGLLTVVKEMKEHFGIDMPD